ncbi:hypothetical protein DNTS_021726, partial [Danionella cerebrum]
ASPLVAVQKQIVRVEVKAGENLNKQQISHTVINKVYEELRRQGLSAEVKMYWREQSDGEVLQRAANSSNSSQSCS